MGNRMRCLRSPCISVVFALLLVLSGSEPCPGNTACAVVQLTAESCPHCYVLDDFINKHEYVYVLFYKTRGNLNHDLNDKFEQFAKEWRWSRVAFGRLDTDRDRQMAEKWSEPHLVPTNIIFRNGQGVQVALTDLDILKRKYEANPEGQKWWLTKYLGDDKDGSNLHYVLPIRTKKRRKRILALPRVIVGFFKDERGAPWNIFNELAWRAHQKPTENVSASFANANASFAAVSSAALAPAGLLPPPSVAIFAGGVLQATLALSARHPDVEELVAWAEKQLDVTQERAEL